MSAETLPSSPEASFVDTDQSMTVDLDRANEFVIKSVVAGAVGGAFGGTLLQNSQTESTTSVTTTHPSHEVAAASTGLLAGVLVFGGIALVIRRAYLQSDTNA